MSEKKLNFYYHCLVPIIKMQNKGVIMLFLITLLEFHGGVMVFNTTFNDISAISLWSVLLVKETRVPGGNHWPTTSQWQTVSHNVVSSTPRMKYYLTTNISNRNRVIFCFLWQINAVAFSIDILRYLDLLGFF